MVNVWESTIFASAMVAILLVDTLALDTVLCCGWQVLMELIAVFTIKIELETDSLSTLIFLHFGTTCSTSSEKEQRELV